MANKFLDSIAEEKKDLQKIRTTLEKIYDIEASEEKRESLEQKRRTQKEKRSRADKQFNIKDMLGVTKSDERKAKKGLFGMLSGLFKGFLGLGAKSILIAAGIGLVGTAMVAYFKSEKFRDGVNTHILKPLGESIIKVVPQLLIMAVRNAMFNAPPASTNPNRFTNNNNNNNPSGSNSGGRSGTNSNNNRSKPNSNPNNPASNAQRNRNPLQQSKGSNRPPANNIQPFRNAKRLGGGNAALSSPPSKSTTTSTKPKIGSTIRSTAGGLLGSIVLGSLDDPLSDVVEATKEQAGFGMSNYTNEQLKKEIIKERNWAKGLGKYIAVKQIPGMDNSQTLRQLELEAERRGGFDKLQKGGMPGDKNDPRTKLGLMENRDYDQKSPLFQQGLKRQSGGLVLFGGHTDVPAGHSQPGTDAPGTELQGKYKPTAEQHFVNEVGKAINRIAKQKNVPVNYRFAKGRYASTSDPNSNWGQINAIRRSGGSAMDLHFDAYGYEGGRLIQGARGVISNGFSLTGTEQKMVGKFGRHPTGASFGVPIIELDPINKAPANVTNYANMIIDAMEGVEGNYTEKGGTTNTNTGSQDSTVTPEQQREIQQTVKQTLNPIDMISGMATSLGKLGGPLGEFVSGALGQVATAFQGSLVAKKQKGGFVGNYKTAYHGLKRRFPEAKPHHVVGAMANFETEAPGIKPNTYQMNGGPGRGIAQWEVPHSGNPTGRWAKAEQMYGKGVINSLNQQLDFVKWEMNTGHPLPDGRPNLPWGRNAKKAWLNSKTSTEATKNFLEGYEAPSIPHMSKRLANAKKFNSQAAVEESRKSGSGGGFKPKRTKKAFGLFQNGGVVGMSQNYHLNNLMEQMDTGPIMVPIPVSAARTGVSTPGGGVGPSSNGTSSNDSYRISMGAAYS